VHRDGCNNPRLLRAQRLRYRDTGLFELLDGLGDGPQLHFLLGDGNLLGIRIEILDQVPQRLQQQARVARQGQDIARVGHCVAPASAENRVFRMSLKAS
jgi:hypothetical protein